MGLLQLQQLLLPMAVHWPIVSWGDSANALGWAQYMHSKYASIGFALVYVRIYLMNNELQCKALAIVLL